METADSSDVPVLPAGRFDGPAEFAGLIRLAFEVAASQGWKEIILRTGLLVSGPYPSPFTTGRSLAGN